MISQTLDVTVNFSVLSLYRVVIYSFTKFARIRKGNKFKANIKDVYLHHIECSDSLKGRERYY